MNILILNWRDIKNPLSGGAEIFTHEMAKRWVKEGHHVVWFTSWFRGSKPHEKVDEIEIIRRGMPDLRTFLNSVHFKAFLFYRTETKGKFDVVIDEIHGMPFFTPLYINEPIVPIICEVAKDIWDKMFSFPWSIIGRYLEYFSLNLYKKRFFLTISQSTKEDLISYGIPKTRISVLPMGINRVKVAKTKKERQLTLIFVARINKMKGIEDAVYTISNIKKIYSDAKLWVVGRGDRNYVSHLKGMVKELGLAKNIHFWNFVSQQKKFELMSRAHFLIALSVREGFGLTIPEAGSVGTPSAVYNVPGLKDIVTKSSGILVKKNSPEELAKYITSSFQNKKLYNKLRSGARELSKKYQWDETANEALSILKRA